MYSNKLISKHQHGFLSKHSTATQLLECVNDWAIKKSKKNQVAIVYLDFAKAFDSIVHKKLLFKLKAYGVDGLLLHWIESLLTDRVQRTRVEKCIYDILTVTSGVPQASVLGPIQFIVYINDLCNLSTKSQNLLTFKMFADDAKVCTSISNIQSAEILQVCLNDILNWADMWQLQLSPSKCSVLQFDKICVNNSYAINGVILPLVKNISDLGITIENYLDFKLHVSNI